MNPSAFKIVVWYPYIPTSVFSHVKFYVTNESVDLSVPRSNSIRLFVIALRYVVPEPS
jgi:hypothetical protein